MKTFKQWVLLFFQLCGNLLFFKKSPEKGTTYRTFQQNLQNINQQLIQSNKQTKMRKKAFCLIVMYFYLEDYHNQNCNAGKYYKVRKLSPMTPNHSSSDSLCPSSWSLPGCSLWSYWWLALRGKGVPTYFG